MPHVASGGDPRRGRRRGVPHPAGQVAGPGGGVACIGCVSATRDAPPAPAVLRRGVARRLCSRRFAPPPLLPPPTLLRSRRPSPTPPSSPPAARRRRRSPTTRRGRPTAWRRRARTTTPTPRRRRHPRGRGRGRRPRRRRHSTSARRGRRAPFSALGGGLLVGARRCWGCGSPYQQPLADRGRPLRTCGLCQAAVHRCGACAAAAWSSVHKGACGAWRAVAVAREAAAVASRGWQGTDSGGGATSPSSPSSWTCRATGGIGRGPRQRQRR